MSRRCSVASSPVASLLGGGWATSRMTVYRFASVCLEFAAALSLSSASVPAALAGRSARRIVATIKMPALRIVAACSAAGSHAAAEFVASFILHGPTAQIPWQ